MDYLFRCLEGTRGVKQLEKYHPEGDVFTHLLQVTNHALRESNDTDLILAAMLHDVGKAVVPHGHAQEALVMLDGHISVKTAFLIENHMRYWDWMDGTMNKLKKVQLLANHPWLPELAQLARWDRKGRKVNSRPKYNRQDIVDRLNKCALYHFGGKNENKTA